MGYSPPKLSDHPNYQKGSPAPGETQIQFALRAAAELVSPPKEYGEDYEVQCDEAAKQIQSLDRVLQRSWNSR